MKKQILALALMALAPVAVEKVEDMRELLLAKVEKQRGKSLIRWSIFGWKIRWSIRDRDVEAVKAKIREVKAATVETYLERLAAAL